MRKERHHNERFAVMYKRINLVEHGSLRQVDVFTDVTLDFLERVMVVLRERRKMYDAYMEGSRSVLARDTENIPELNQLRDLMAPQPLFLDIVQPGKD